MTFNFYETEIGKQFKKKDYVKESKNLLMVRHGNQPNNLKWQQFDCSVFNKQDIVLLVDADWLAFSTTANEMIRKVVFSHDGITKEFLGCYTEMKKYCLDSNIEYAPSKGIKVQELKPNATVFAKASVKKKVKHLIEATGASKVVMFCGSTGNHRDSIELPKLNDRDCFLYKGQRESEWIPSNLKEVKSWIMENWYSHWAVGEESDDCITVAKHTLDSLGVKNYICGIDKDYCGEGYGGLYILGHHEKPIWLEDTAENKLGWIKATKTSGGSDKMTGQGDMFLAYQVICSDDSDNYSAKAALKHLGSLKQFGNKGCEKYLMQFKTNKELWQGVVDHFNKHLPSRFIYKDCFDNTVIGNPMDLLNIFFKCAKMREYEDHVPNIFEDRLIPLGVEY